MASEDPIETVRLALSVRDSGDYTEAAKILEKLLERFPETEPIYYELAFIHRLQGKHRQAVRTLDSALAHKACSSRVLLLGGHMLHATGSHDEGDSHLDRVSPKTEQERVDLRTLFEFGDFLRDFPFGRSMVLLDRLKRRLGWLGTQQVADRVSAALRERKPFALIRLGDGEGGMLTLSEQDESKYHSLYLRNRDELIRIWFGQEFEWRIGPFWAQAQRLSCAIVDADVVGIPYESWLAHEYAISSFRGIPSLVNVYRHLGTAEIDGLLCSQHIHLDLFREGLLSPIIKLATQVHVVTCLPEVREALIHRLDLADVTIHLVPAEQGSKNVLGPTAAVGIHYPDVFEELVSKLSNSSAGHLFLIAAGLLGKFYCQAVKNGGGIAVDVGSLIDAWLERPTRPGYGTELRL